MIEKIILIVFLVITILASFAPLALSIIAALKLHKFFGNDATIFLSIGAVCFALLPLDVLASIAVSRLDAETLAKFMLVKSSILMAITYIASILVSVGMFMVCKKFQAKVQQGG